METFAIGNTGASVVSKLNANFTELIAVAQLLVSITGCEMAFSRKKLGSQSNWAVVRNAANVEAIIPFSGNWPDAAALVAHAAGTDVFIKQLYDQSGNGRHLKQSTAASQPRFLASGLPTSVQYNPGMVFDGSNDVLLTDDLISFSENVTALCAINALSGNDKVVFSVGSSTAGEQNWYAPMTDGSGNTRVGATDGYNLWDRTISGRRGVGVYCDPTPVPIFLDKQSGTNWTQTLSQPVAGNFTPGIVRLGGQAAGTFATLQAIACGVWGRQLTYAELVLVGQGLGFGASGIVIGDSTIAAYSSENEVALYLMTTANQIRSHGCRTIAVPGDTAAQQLEDYLALATKRYAEWVIIQVGLNDVAYTAAAATISSLQQLVNTVRIQSPFAKIIIATMTPAYNRWADVPVDPATTQAKWVAVNAAIKGEGATPITNVDARVSSHTDSLTLLVSGNASLAPAYDLGDGIHENNAGRAIIATAWNAALTTLGFF